MRRTILQARNPRIGPISIKDLGFIQAYRDGLSGKSVMVLSPSEALSDHAKARMKSLVGVDELPESILFKVTGHNDHEIKGRMI